MKQSLHSVRKVLACLTVAATIMTAPLQSFALVSKYELTGHNASQSAVLDLINPHNRAERTLFKFGKDGIIRAEIANNFGSHRIGDDMNADQMSAKLVCLINASQKTNQGYKTVANAASLGAAAAALALLFFPPTTAVGVLAATSVGTGSTVGIFSMWRSVDREKELAAGLEKVQQIRTIIQSLNESGGADLNIINVQVNPPEIYNSILEVLRSPGC